MSSKQPTSTAPPVRDPYAILGVARDCSFDDVKRAYRKLAQKWHPDRSSGNAEKMQDIQWAYDLLSSEEKRERWDLSGTEVATGDIDNKAIQAIAFLFSKWLDLLLAPDSEDFHLAPDAGPLEYIRDTARAEIANVTSVNKKMGRQLKRVRKLKGRFGTASGEPNVFEFHLTEVEKKLNHAIQHNEDHRALNEKVLDILPHFSFDRSGLDRTVAKHSTSPFFLSTFS